MSDRKEEDLVVHWYILAQILTEDAFTHTDLRHGHIFKRNNSQPLVCITQVHTYVHRYADSWGLATAHLRACCDSPCKCGGQAHFPPITLAIITLPHEHGKLCWWYLSRIQTATATKNPLQGISSLVGACTLWSHAWDMYTYILSTRNIALDHLTCWRYIHTGTPTNTHKHPHAPHTHMHTTGTELPPITSLVTWSEH